MERVECPRHRKYLYFLLRLIRFICYNVLIWENRFPNERTQYWYRLSRVALDRILQGVIRHTPCDVLSAAYYQGILTAQRRVLRIVGDTINRTSNRRARCLQPFLQVYERKYITHI